MSARATYCLACGASATPSGPSEALIDQFALIPSLAAIGPLGADLDKYVAIGDGSSRI
jgi:hypothetical protein